MRTLRRGTVPRSALLRGGRLGREQIHSVVVDVAGVPLHPGETDGTARVDHHVDQWFPQVAVGDGLAGGVLPPSPAPSLPPPIAKTVHDIGRVTMDGQRAVDLLERPNYGGELHALVRRGG